MLTKYQLRLEAILKKLLPDPTQDKLSEAMSYSTLNGGKRLRAALTYAIGEDFGCALTQLDHAACAIECLHAYSLIHDDLPAMDNDDLRRGKPSCHKVFGEAIAILAGDALNTLAFSLLSSSLLPETIQIAQIRQLSHAAGWAGMVGGQSRDILATQTTITLTELETIHHTKTGALFKACLHLGALPSKTYQQHHQTLDTLGKMIGISYQIIDDILDSTVETKTLGKTAGKDAIQGKSTYISLLGRQESQRIITDFRSKTNALLATLPNHAPHLSAIIDRFFARLH